jgi:hypothetical protein
MKKMLSKRFDVEDIKQWQKASKKDNRNLSSWMRDRLNKCAKKELNVKRRTA